MSRIEQINEGIKEAIKSRNTLRLNTLRMLKSKILALDARANLSEDEVIKLFKTYFGNIQEALEMAQTANRTDLTESLKGELMVIQEFLPQTLNIEETEKVVKEAIAASGAKTKKDFGIVMKHVMQQNLPIDAKLVKEFANQYLI